MAKRTSAAKMDEVNDLESEPSPAKEMDLSGGLAFVTFVALLLGLVMAQMAMKKYFLTGLFV